MKRNYSKGWKVTKTGELYLGNFPIYENKTSIKTKEGNNIIIMLWDSLNFKTTKDNHVNYYKVEVFIPENHNNIFQILINQKPLNKDLDEDCFFRDLSKYKFQELPLLINTENIRRDGILNYLESERILAL